MINKFIGIGNLTQKPELKNAGGYNKCNFAIAINSTKTEVIFLDVECWNKVAENCIKFLSKGSCVYIEGKIKLNKWVAKDGSNKQRFFISADLVRFLPNGKKGESIDQEESSSNIEFPQPSDSIKEIINPENLPF